MLWLLLWYFLPEFGFTLVLQMVVGVGLFLFGLPLIPGAIKTLSNQPNRYQPEGCKDLVYQKSMYGFFTFLQPGRVKIIERGQRFIRAIMAFDGHRFKGEGDNTLEPEHEDYWEVEETPKKDTEKGASDSQPLPAPTFRLGWLVYFPFNLLWWVWKRWVYRTTGGIFVGVPLFQNVRTYPLERFKAKTHENGTVTLERIHDYSDHYRVADFQYPNIVPEADTKDKIRVRILLNEVARVYNPYKTAYNTDDDWLTRFGASLDDATTSTTKSLPLDEVLSAGDEPDAAEKLGQMITDRLHESVQRIGIHVQASQIRDISPVTDVDKVDLGKFARAKIQRQSDEEMAKGKAAYVREEAEAMKAHPDAAAVVNAEAMVRAAEAVGKAGGTVFLGGGSLDPVQVAILNALKQKVTT